MYDLAASGHNQALRSTPAVNLWTRSRVHPQIAERHCRTTVRRDIVSIMKAIPVLAVAIVGLVLTSTSATAVPRTDMPTFVWPLDPRPRIVTPFDPPVHDWLPGHRGVDLGGYDGQVVRAAGAGIVVFAGLVAGKPVVSIEHEGGLRTTYEPVRALVTAGDRVRTASTIGTLDPGHPGCADPCLHWGLRRDRTYLDPTRLVQATPIRLKPLK